jgi:hypothetical protein
MGVLTAVLTHLDAPRVEKQLGWLRALAPGERFVVCHSTLQALHAAHVRDDESISHVLTVEYDHLILQPDYAQRLTDLSDRCGAGLLAKWASPRNDTNWPHYLRARDDQRLNAYISSISRRDDAGVRYGCIGTGLFFTREALTALCALEDPPPAYFELFIPTAVHHLGFDVVDVDAVSDLYAGVRWLPEYTAAEVRSARHAGRVFAHPFKRIDELDQIA